MRFQSTIPVRFQGTIPVRFQGHDSSAIPRHDSGAIPRHDSSAIPRHDSSAIPRHDSSAIPRHDSSAIPRHDSSAIPRHDSSAIPNNDSGSIPVEEYYDRIVKTLDQYKSADMKKRTDGEKYSEARRQLRNRVDSQELMEVGKASDHSCPETEKDEAGVRSVGKSVYVELMIGDSRCEAMLDTGSDVTLIPAMLADMSQIRGSSRKLRAANGSLINLLGGWKTTIRMENLHLSMEFLVSDQIDEILIGIDWMRAHRCQILLDRLTIVLHGQQIPLLEKYTMSRCHRLILQQEIEIPGNSEMLVNGQVVYSNLKREVPAVWMADTVECVPGVRAASMVMSSRGGTDLPVRLVNTKNETGQLPRGMKLNSLHDVLSISSSVSKESAIPESGKPVTADEHIEKILSEVHPEVTKNQKSQLESLLKHYSDIL